MSPDGLEERYAESQERLDEAYDRDALAQAEADDWFDHMDRANAESLAYFLDRVLK